MKAKLEKLLPTTPFARAVSVLVGGTASAQLIMIAASPILTRLYTPEDFGLLAVFVGILGILGVMASLRYQLAIPLPETDGEAMNVTILSTLILAALTLLLATFVWGFGDHFVILLNAPDLEPYLWLVPVGFASIGIYQVLQYWSLRAKAFSLIAKTKMVQSTSVAVLQIIAASLGPLALLGGRVIGQVMVDTMLFRGAGISKLSVKENVSAKGLIAAAKVYRQFPIFSSWAGLLNAGGAQMPALFFAAAFSPAAAGGYMLAQRVINMPLSIIGTAVSDAFLPKSVDALREGRLGAQVSKLLSALASLIFPGTALLYFVAPDLFQVVFGDNWKIAGEIVRWLSPMLAIQFLVSPVSRIFVTVERQDYALLLQSILFGLRVASLIVVYALDYSLIAAVKIFSLGSVAGYLVYLVVICRVTRISPVDLVKLNFETIIFTSMVFVFCSQIYSYFDGYVLAFSLCVLGGGIFLSINLFIFSKKMRLKR